MNDFENFFEPLRDAHLKDHERAQMRTSLIAFMRKNPHLQSFWKTAWYRVTEIQISLRLHPLVTAFVLVVCVGTGTSFAAENALPGDALYAIKTNVTEKAIGAFAVSRASKVEWSTVLTNRRLSEAEQLVSQGRLTPLAVADITSGLAEATKETDDGSDSSANSSQEVTDAQSDLQASLQAHAHVLAAFEAATSSEPSQVSVLLQTVNSHARGVAQVRGRTERAIARKHSAGLKESADTKRSAAEHAVQTLEQLAVSARDAFGTTTSDDISTGAQNAADRVSIGTKQLDSGDYSGALGSYQAAIRAANETRISLDAARHVKRKLRSLHSKATNTDPVKLEATTVMKISTEPMPATVSSDLPNERPSIAPASVPDSNSTGDSNKHGQDKGSDDDSVRVELHF